MRPFCLSTCRLAKQTYLAVKINVGVVAVVAAFAFKVNLLGHADVEGIVGQVGPLQFAREVRVGHVVDDAAVGPRLVAR